MSVLARNTIRENRSRGIASIFLILGTVGAPFALMVLPFATILAGGTLFDDPISMKALASTGAAVGLGLGLLGWAMTIPYIFAARMKLSSALLMWSIHIAANFGLSIPWLMEASLGDWPILIVGLFYLALSLAAAAAGIRDILDLPTC